MKNDMRFLMIFWVCRTLETFPYTLQPHQHQLIHFQHKTKIIIFLTYFSDDFEIDFHWKSMLFFSKNYSFLLVRRRRWIFDCKSIDFSIEINTKIIWKISQKYYNFYFMLEMYNLMLVSVESVWDRFWGPTDSKNCQNRMVIQANPLQ